MRADGRIIARIARTALGTPRDANASTQELEARRIHDARRHVGLTVGEGLDRTQGPGI